MPSWSEPGMVRVEAACLAPPLALSRPRPDHPLRADVASRRDAILGHSSAAIHAVESFRTRGAARRGPSTLESAARNGRPAHRQLPERTLLPAQLAAGRLRSGAGPGLARPPAPPLGRARG